MGIAHRLDTPSGQSLYSREPVMAHIAIIGAGITGVTTAYALLDAATA